MENFRKNVELVMLEKGITKTELAKKLDTTVQNVYNITKRNNPSFATVEKLSDILDVPVERLIGGTKTFSDEFARETIAQLKERIEELQKDKQHLQEVVTNLSKVVSMGKDKVFLNTPSSVGGKVIRLHPVTDLETPLKRA